MFFVKILLANENIEAIANDKALDYKLNICESTLVDCSLHSVNINFTISVDVIIPKNSAKVRKYVLKK